MMKKLAFLLALTTTNAIACIQNDVSYDILLIQNPHLTCDQLLKQVNKTGLSIDDIDARNKTIHSLVVNLNAQFSDLKWKMIDGQIEFDENALTSISQQISSLETERTQLQKLRAQIWQRNRDERIAKENQQRASRKEVTAKIEAIERGQK
jgi:hypothetical protein